MSTALVAVVAVVLLGSGISHLVHRDRLGASLAAHAVLRPALRRAVTTVLPGVETTLGIALAATLVLGGALTPAAALTAGVVLAAMTGYVHVAARRVDDVTIPCGCGLGEAPLGLWTTVRAGLLAVLAVGGGLTVGTTPALSRPADELVVVVAATVALAIGITALPQARAELPGALR